MKISVVFHYNQQGFFEPKESGLVAFLSPRIPWELGTVSIIFLFSDMSAFV